jgi:hypothetical protein
VFFPGLSDVSSLLSHVQLMVLMLMLMLILMMMLMKQRLFVKDKAV